MLGARSGGELPSVHHDHVRPLIHEISKHRKTMLIADCQTKKWRKKDLVWPEWKWATLQEARPCILLPSQGIATSRYLCLGRTKRFKQQDDTRRDETYPKAEHPQEDCQWARPCREQREPSLSGFRYKWFWSGGSPAKNRENPTCCSVASTGEKTHLLKGRLLFSFFGLIFGLTRQGIFHFLNCGAAKLLYWPRWVPYLWHSSKKTNCWTRTSLCQIKHLTGVQQALEPWHDRVRKIKT